MPYLRMKATKVPKIAVALLPDVTLACRGFFRGFRRGKHVDHCPTTSFQIATCQVCGAPQSVSSHPPDVGSCCATSSFGTSAYSAAIISQSETPAANVWRVSRQQATFCAPPTRQTPNMPLHFSHQHPGRGSLNLRIQIWLSSLAAIAACVPTDQSFRHLPFPQSSRQTPALPPPAKRSISRPLLSSGCLPPPAFHLPMASHKRPADLIRGSSAFPLCG